MKSTTVQGAAVERVAALLRGSPLFRSLSDAHLRLAVTQANLVQLEPGETIGNQLLNESLAALARSGTVDAEEALAKAVDKVDLARRLGRSAG